MSISQLGALAHADPNAAKRRILDALFSARGDREAAAQTLHTTHRSLYRYITRLRLWDDLDQMIAQNGFPRIPGPPRLPERIREAIVASRGSYAKAAASLGIDPEQLRARIAELGLWEQLDEALVAVGARALVRPASKT